LFEERAESGIRPQRVHQWIGFERGQEKIAVVARSLQPQKGFVLWEILRIGPSSKATLDGHSR